MGDGPPNKWNKLQVSPRHDQTAISSDDLLNALNNDTDYAVTAAFAVACSDGTFAFIGSYTS